MRKAKDLIGKAIIHQETGEKVAVVHDVIVDAEAQRVSALLTDTGGWFRDARVVPWSKVTSVGDVVMVQGEMPVITTASSPEIANQIKPDARITGTAVVSDAGERIGTVGDLFINDAGDVMGYEIKQGFVSLSGRKFLPADNIQAVGKDAIIASASDLQSVKQAGRQHDEEQTTGV